MLTTVTGHRYTAGTSQRCEASLRIQGEMLAMTGDEGRVQMARLSEVEISDRVGNIKRKIRWPNDDLFETDDNEAIDQLIAHLSGKKHGAGQVHRLERNWGWVAVAGFFSIAVTVAFFIWGLPALSHRIAHALPVSTHELVSTGALTAMDKLFFKPSELSDDKQAELSRRLDNLIADIDTEGFTMKLHFRQMKGIANAMALPSGDLIVTDALVALADVPDELDAVLLHEVGHVLERHGMQHVVSATTMTAILSLVIGDVSGINELVTGIPIFLMQSNYSRKSEAGADEFAFHHMMRTGVDPVHFASIITKLGNQNLSRKPVDESNDENGSEESPDYLSSHPSTDSRADRARQLSEEFNADPDRRVTGDN